MPYIEKCRAEVAGHEVDDAEEVPDSLWAEYYFDGEPPQVNYMNRPEVCREGLRRKVLYIKLNPSRSAHDQPCDNCPIFKTIKKLVSSPSRLSTCAVHPLHLCRSRHSLLTRAPTSSSTWGAPRSYSRRSSSATRSSRRP